jgi:hypothetical protein
MTVSFIGYLVDRLVRRRAISVVAYVGRSVG